MFLSFLKKIQIAMAILSIPVLGVPCSVPVAPVAEATTVQEATSLISGYVATKNPSLRYGEDRSIANGIVYYSSMYGIDPFLMTALFETESNFNQGDVSDAGAIGIGQLMPETAASLGVNPYDTMENIQGSCSYLSTALQTFRDWPEPVAMALAAYNAGTQTVINYGGIPPYPETQNYVLRIRDRYFNLRAMMGETINVPDYVPAQGGDASYAPAGGSSGGYVEYVEQDPPSKVILDQEDD